MAPVTHVGRMRYGFPEWAEAHVADPPTPVLVDRYFRERNYEMSREFWRDLLRGDIRHISIETWCEICDHAGVDFATFWSYTPAGAPPVPRKLPSSRSTAATPKPDAESKPGGSFGEPPPDISKLLPR